MNQTKLRRNAFYPLSEKLPMGKYSKVRAVWDGKPAREPRKGEWFLSGAIIEAYQAKNDLGSKYRIAKLVRVETRSVTTITEYLDNDSNPLMSA